jgi:hypothetical protein
MADEKTFDLTEYNGGPLVATCISLLVLSWVAVGLRTYTRVVLMKSYQADDWLMLVAQVGLNGVGVFVFLKEPVC